MKTRRSILSLLLVFVMVLSLLPGGAVAVAADGTEGTAIEQQGTASETTLPENTDGSEGDDESAELTETPTLTETPAVSATPTDAQTDSVTNPEQTTDPAETVYTVTFEVNGGSEVEAQEVKDGETANEPEAPSKEGYTFGGWFEDGTCVVAFDFDTPITGDVKVYAKWTEIKPDHPAFNDAKTVDGVTVTVSAPEGVFPKGSYLSVESVPVSAQSMVDDAVENERDANANVAVSYTFDIKVLDTEGNEVQPADAQSVKVSFALAEAKDDNLEAQVYHISDEGNAEVLDTSVNGDAVEAVTDGFSFYTVEFTYGTMTYVLPGGSEVKLSDVLSYVGLSGEVTAASGSNDELFSITKESGEWMIHSHQPFTTEEKLSVIINGVVYEIIVTDTNVSGTIYASSLADNDSLVLTGDTTLIVDTDKTLKSISGNYALTIQGDHIFTVLNSDGHAIDVKSLSCESVLRASGSGNGLNIKQDITLTGSTLIRGTYGIYCENGNVTIDVSDGFEITGEKDAIKCNGTFISITGNGSITATYSNQSGVEGDGINAKGNILLNGNIVIDARNPNGSNTNSDGINTSDGRVQLSGGNLKVYAQRYGINVTANDLVNDRVFLDGGHLYLEAAGSHAIYATTRIQIQCAVDAYSASEETLKSDYGIWMDSENLYLGAGQASTKTYNGEYEAAKNAYHCQIVYKSLTGDYQLNCSSTSPAVGDPITFTAVNAPEGIQVTWQRRGLGVTSPWEDITQPVNDVHNDIHTIQPSDVGGRIRVMIQWSSPYYGTFTKYTNDILIPQVGYGVSFDPGRGTGHMDSVFVEENETFTVPECTFTPPNGQVFKAWYLSLGSSAREYYYPGDQMTVDRNRTLYAAYGYVITIDPNGGETTHETFVTVENPINPLIQELRFNEINGFITPPLGKKLISWKTNDGQSHALTNKIWIDGPTTVQAVYETVYIPYSKVTFDPNGGSVTPTSAQTGEDGRLTSLPTPTREGHSFNGWYSYRNGGYSIGISRVYTEDTTIYAQWEKKSYTVSFDTHSGSAVPPQIVQYNEKAVRPAADPTKGGWDFTGWYEDAACTAPFDFSKPITANTTIHAGWEPVLIQFTVDFNVDGGTPVPSQTVTEGDKVTKPEDPTKSGFTFAGWYKNSRKTVSFDFDNTEIYANTTIYAKWVANGTTQHYVHFMDGSRTLGQQRVYSGQTAERPTADYYYEKEGYLFVDWFEDSALTIPFDFENTPITSNTRIYSKWEEGHVVTYQTGGHTPGPNWKATVTVKDGTVLTVAAPAEDVILPIAGDVFDGWEIDSVRYAPGATYTVGSDIEVKYLWRTGVVSHTVTFDTHGGSDIAPVPVYNGETVTQPADPTKNGYAFFGWYTDVALTEKYDFSASVTGDITLHAKWLPAVIGLHLKTDVAVKNGANYKLNVEELTEIFHHAAVPVTLDTLEITDLYTNQDLTVALTTAPTTGTAYYFAVNMQAGDDDNPLVFWDDVIKTGGCITEARDGVIEFVELFRSPNSGSATVIFKYTKLISIVYGVNVTNGTADKSTAEEGVTVTLTANPAPFGQEFDKWIVDGGDISLTDENASTTTFTMPAENVGVTATYKDLTYTVSFKDGDTILSTVTVIHGGTVAEPATDPGKDGYSFEGWYEDPTFNVVFDFDQPITADTPVYAKFTPITYTVTVNSGTADKASAAAGETVMLTADAAPSGKTFDKWVVNAGGVSLTDETASTTTFTMPAANVEVTATYKDLPPVTYTVTFKDGENTLSTATVNSGAKVTKPADPSKSGYSFDGWYEDPTFNVVFDFEQPITANTSVYAKFIPITVTGISIATPGKTVYTVGEALDVSGMTIKVDYSDGTSATIPVTAAMVSGFDSSAPAASQTLTITYEGKTTTYDVSISAAAPVTYDITVNVGANGTASASAASATAGTTITVTATANSGYEIDKITYTPEGGSETDITSTKSFTMPAAKVTVDVSFKASSVTPPGPATYTVTFKDGDSVLSTVTVNSGEKVAKPADPTKTGYTFNGWFADATFTAAFDFDQAITANTTVYAKFTKDSDVPPATITYTVIGGADSTWTKGSSSTVTITVKRSEDDANCFSHFTGVEIDGTALAASDYEAKSGSTIVTIKAAALQKLSTGKHTVTVKFDDGEVGTSLTVKAASGSTDKPTSPETGDESNLRLWVLLMLMSILGFIATVLVGRKKRQHSR